MSTEIVLMTASGNLIGTAEQLIEDAKPRHIRVLIDTMDFVFERTPSLYSSKPVYVVVETYCITNFRRA